MSILSTLVVCSLCLIVIGTANFFVLRRFFNLNVFSVWSNVHVLPFHTTVQALKAWPSWLMMSQTPQDPAIFHFICAMLSIYFFNVLIIYQEKKRKKLAHLFSLSLIFIIFEYALGLSVLHLFFFCLLKQLIIFDKICFLSLNISSTFSLSP